jgi:uncharacterized protein YdeI (YjbR/CyaY-like superfamily)
MIEPEEILFPNREEWRKWLEINHNRSEGIWMVYYKKHSSKESVSYNDAVEEALCFGWIDSLVKTLDNEKYKQKYTPRRKNSVWSKINKERIEKMINEGKMTSFGMKKVKEAKLNGEWEKAYEMRTKPELPQDLKIELQKNEDAWQNFQNFAQSYQSTYIYWLNSAKRPETREKRIKQIIKHAHENQKPGIL